jgi:hypothetical protein
MMKTAKVRNARGRNSVAKKENSGVVGRKSVTFRANKIGPGFQSPNFLTTKN